MSSTKFESWLKSVDEVRKDYWESRFDYKPYTPLTYQKGNKYIKIWDETTIWGFVSMVDGVNKGVPIKVGDLLKPAGINSPAKHSRGNIFDGTAKWTYYGPNYL